MFDLEMPKVQKFPQTGTQLSSLSRRDFERITGDKDTASVLYRHLGYIQGRPEVDLVSDADEEEDEELDELKEPLSKPGLSQKYLGKHYINVCQSIRSIWDKHLLHIEWKLLEMSHFSPNWPVW